MKSQRVAFLLLIMAISFSAGGVVSYTEDRREAYSIGSSGEVPYSNYYYPDPLFSNWTNGYFRSILTPSNLTAQGDAYAYSEFDWHEDGDTFDISFYVAQKTSMDFTGVLSAEDFGFGWGTASAALYSGDSIAATSKVYGLSVSAGSWESIYTNFNTQLDLDIGIYRLVLEADAVPGETSSGFNASASFTPTHTTNGTLLSWMTTYNLTDDLLDPDHDGHETWQEYLANTNPTNPHSFFQISLSTTNHALTFQTSTNRNYSVEYSTNLNSNIWVNLTNGISGTGLPENIPFSPSAPTESYRAKVHMP